MSFVFIVHSFWKIIKVYLPELKTESSFNSYPLLFLCLTIKTILLVTRVLYYCVTGAITSSFPVIFCRLLLGAPSDLLGG